MLGCVVDADVDRCCQRSDGHFPFGVELNEEANADRLAAHAHVLCDSLGGERVGDRVLFTHRSLTTPDRAGLCSLLLGLSGWRGHADRFPTRYNAGRAS